MWWGSLSPSGGFEGEIVSFRSLLRAVGVVAIGASALLVVGVPVQAQVPPQQFVEAILTGSSPNDAQDVKTALVMCPAGLRALSGGFENVGAAGGIDLTASRHVSTPAGEGWEAVAREHVPIATAWRLDVFAVCGDVPGLTVTADPRQIAASPVDDGGEGAGSSCGPIADATAIGGGASVTARRLINFGVAPLGIASDQSGTEAIVPKGGPALTLTLQRICAQPALPGLARPSASDPGGNISVRCPSGTRLFGTHIDNTTGSGTLDAVKPHADGGGANFRRLGGGVRGSVICLPFGPGRPADIAVGLTAAPQLDEQAPTIKYTVTATNPGPAFATNVQVGIRTPAGFTGAVSDTCEVAKGTVVCTFDTIAAGSSATAEFRMSLRLLPVDTVHATATRTASTPTDPAAGNDTATATCLVETPQQATCEP